MVASLATYMLPMYGMALVQYRLGAMDIADRCFRYTGAFLETSPDIQDLNWGLTLFYIGSIPSKYPVVRSYLEAGVNIIGSNGVAVKSNNVNCVLLFMPLKIFAIMHYP